MQPNAAASLLQDILFHNSKLWKTGPANERKFMQSHLLLSCKKLPEALTSGDCCQWMTD